MVEYLRMGMAASLFLLGFCSCIAGVWTMLAKQYNRVLRSISAHSAKVSTKALTDAGLAPVIEALSGLVEALNHCLLYTSPSPRD